MRTILTALLMTLATQAAAHEYYEGQEAEKIFTSGEVMASGYEKGSYWALVKYRRQYYECLASIWSSGLEVHWCRGADE